VITPPQLLPYKSTYVSQIEPGGHSEDVDKNTKLNSYQILTTERMLWGIDCRLSIQFNTLLTWFLALMSQDSSSSLTCYQGNLITTFVTYDVVIFIMNKGPNVDTVGEGDLNRCWDKLLSQRIEKNCMPRPEAKHYMSCIYCQCLMS